MNRDNAGATTVFQRGKNFSNANKDNGSRLQVIISKQIIFSMDRIRYTQINFSLVANHRSNVTLILKAYTCHSCT